uniref:CRISPR-associated endonuclease Cas1 n=1 Tax=Strongyloides venezuelensis TaxID=75913 RepID=A0A0K0FBX3_STRVS
MFSDVFEIGGSIKFGNAAVICLINRLCTLVEAGGNKCSIPLNISSKIEFRSLCYLATSYDYDESESFPYSYWQRKSLRGDQREEMATRLLALYDIYSALGNAMRKDPEYQKFADPITQKLRSSSKRLKKCEYLSYKVAVLESDKNKVRRKFLELQKNKATFSLFIISEKKKKLHSVIKQIGKEYGIPTQIICHKSIEAVLEKEKFNILLNILLSIDEKCGFKAFF